MEANQQHKPEWIRVKRLDAATRELMQRSLGGQPTVCQSANCPNIGECWRRGTATFMIMGDICTRNCRFCGVHTGIPKPLDSAEPERLVESIAGMGLKFAVLTCVDRDDLPDGGAAHWAACIEAVRGRMPEVGVEALVGDFQGSAESIVRVVMAEPQVYAHNVEVVKRLQPVARPAAAWDRSLTTLVVAKETARKLGIPLLTKTGLMLGLGETADEVRAAIDEIAALEIDLLTLGQYLRPVNQPGLLPVERYVPPEEFAELADYARSRGLKGVAASPLTRSSHFAETLFADAGGSV
jgi:lipoic acid synthetase